MSNSGNRSRIYYLLQEEEDSDEIICMFAYAVYKKQKMQEIKRLQDCLGRAPTNEELQPFVDNAETRIDSFCKLAAIELSNFQDTILGNYIDEISADYEKRYAEAIKKFQPQKPPSWLKSALYGFAGNIITAIVTFIFVVIGLIAIKGLPGFWQTILPYIATWAQGGI